ncbi:MAG: phosphopantothenoylcysteine decarboxylase [Planctomycetota bacterium]
MWLLTAGPTREHLDEVRPSTNASGAMGHAPGRRGRPPGPRGRPGQRPGRPARARRVRRVDVVSAEDMLRVAGSSWRWRPDVLLGVAAVRLAPGPARARRLPARPAVGPWPLVPNPVLRTLAATGRVRCPVGFALESLDERGGFQPGGRSPGCRWPARPARPRPERAGGDGGRHERGLRIVAGGSRMLGTAAKQELARSIVDHVEADLRACP